MPNTKLIVKNTIALYIRSFISLILSLWTARLVLAYLGIEDYGVYNAVGGIVSLIGFIQSSMAAATQRFIAFHIGLGDERRLKEVFTMCVNVHIILSLALVVIIEIFGLWYIQNSLDYGDVDFDVVKLVFHTSVISLFFLINSVPFNSLLIARESMKVFAYIDILSKVLKFILALSLSIVAVRSRLSIYSIFILGISIIIFFIYVFSCLKKYDEAHYFVFWDSKLFKQLFAYTGWVTLPSIVSIFKSQGMVVVLNNVFGPVFNAAQGIANQINNAIKSLANNVGAAFAPQITITYAQEDYQSMSNLFILGSKITFYLFAFMAIPMCVEIDFILDLWLKEVPPYANTIAVLIMLDTLISSMTSCYNTAIRATGNIRFYELTYNLIHILGIVLIVFIVKFGCEYYIPYLILAMLSFLSMFWQFYCMKRVLPFVSIKAILLSIVQMILVIIITLPVVLLALHINFSSRWFEFFFILGFNTILLAVVIFYIGLTKSEQTKVRTFINQKLHKTVLTKGQCGG